MLAGILVAPGAAFAEGRPVDGRIDVQSAEFKPVFPSGEKVYPGTRLSLGYSFQLDVMRHMHRERECWSKWFGGIDCKYVDHSDGSNAGEDQAPALFRLEAVDSDPKAAGDGYDPEPHIPPKSGSLEVGYGGEGDVQYGFTAGVMLTARVGERWGAQGSKGPLNRTSCRNFVDGGTCSQGEYVVKLRGWDVSDREKKLKAYLAKPRTAADLAIGGAVLDYFLVNDVDQVKGVERRGRLAASLLEHVSTHYPTVGGEPPQEQRDILAIAAELDPGSQQVQAAMVQNRIDSGLLVEAKDANNRSLADLKQAYESGDRTAKTLSSYGTVLRQAGTILAKEYVGSNLDAVSAAAEFYAASVRVWLEHRQLGSGTHPPKDRA